MKLSKVYSASSISTIPILIKKADDFMHTAVGTMLDVMEYDKLAEVVQTSPPPKISTRTSSRISVRRIIINRGITPTPKQKLSIIPIRRRSSPGKAIVDPEKIAIFNLMVEDYWNTLDDTEKKIYRLREQGYTQGEVAKNAWIFRQQRRIKTPENNARKIQRRNGNLKNFSEFFRIREYFSFPPRYYIEESFEKAVFAFMNIAPTFLK
jgi:hypothetical protein